MTTVLLCDDDAAVRFALEEALASLGLELRSVASGAEAIAAAPEVDVVVTDLAMPGVDGFGVLAHYRQFDPGVPVIMVTARGSERAAVQALKDGAYDYLTKPFAVEELRASVRRAAETRALRASAAELRAAQGAGASLVGESPPMRRLVADARRVGQRDVPVLLRGETGTGKELVASLLHAASGRRGACVRFNCAALAEGLAEAELFGHERGAFTGATTARPGYFRRAHGGTLVLDEVGELPLSLQSKLLRVLQEREVQPVGATAPVAVDVRVVASTHRDLRAMVKTGQFREDLYYRLAVVELVVPPLRDRSGDVPRLIAALHARWSERLGDVDVTFGPDLLAALAARPWPGNVRELENTVARLLALAEPGAVLDARALGDADDATTGGGNASGAGDTTVRSGEGVPPPASGPLRAQVARFERDVVARMLAATGGNQSEAARRLAVSRMTLIEKMKRYGLR